ncbi:MAG: 2-succinyl-5-enolpyruvyl-6-hydroxy-3-cyclohexene-1-carboxylic-acid synthase [Allomuricauda sp.]
MAQQLQEPVAVVCTSGSALLNYYPAVAEAFYSDIPLIVVSSDRPRYSIDIGDGQTIRQENVFEKHIGYSTNLKQDISHARESISKFGPTLLKEKQEEIQAYNEEELEKAVEMACLERTPVHINIPFEEPLYGSVKTPSVKIPHTESKVAQKPNKGNWDEFCSIWKNSPRKMVLVGVNPPNSMEAGVLETLANDGDTLVFTETTSNLHHSSFFPSIDSIIAPIEKSKNREELFQDLQPDLLITFGGMIVSKKIKAFLRKYRPKTHWHIDPKKAYDTFFCLSNHIKAHPNDFFKQIGTSPHKPGMYKANWMVIKATHEKGRETYLKQIPFTDFTVFDQVQGSIPNGYQVHLANSSTVRYAQLFSMHRSLKVYCNRGTSGIDGSTSTAVGASIHADGPTLLITGDLSFLYDSNGLWNAHIRQDFRIIIINNSGGGIFRILPGKEDTEEFSTFFETHHSLVMEDLNKGSGLTSPKVMTKELEDAPNGLDIQNQNSRF